MDKQMDTINTSFNYQYPDTTTTTTTTTTNSTNSTNNSFISTPSSPRNSRFEIYFDHNNQSKPVKLNSPINARLRCYKYNGTGGTSCTTGSTNSSPISSPRTSMIQQFSNYPSNRIPQQQGPSSQSPQQSHPPLLRSSSLPTTEQSQSQSQPQPQPQPQLQQEPNHHPTQSRKSSILSNCTHISDSGSKERSNSCVSCRNSIITMNESTSSTSSTSSNSSSSSSSLNEGKPKIHSATSKRNSILDQLDTGKDLSESVGSYGSIGSIGSIGSVGSIGSEDDRCRRHHHRRESIAIKFENPVVIDQEEGLKNAKSDVFESLKNYKLK